jgi:molecular chaperone HtpG
MVPELDSRPLIGRQLFDVITSGMYDNPLMIFREYVQNSVDSIDLGIACGLLSLEGAQIVIQLKGEGRCITIQDNGPGLSNQEAHVVLRSLGCSPKEGTTQRGFRGIGRLGGLAYCDELVFETRSHAAEQVAVIAWNRLDFEKIATNAEHFVSLLETIEGVSTERFRPAADDEPAHFFRVTLKNLRRFHADVLMNVKVVHDYLAQVAPVGYEHKNLHFAGMIEEYFSASADFRCYNLIVNGRQVMRPYADIFQVSVNVSDTINDIEFFTFIGVDNEPIAHGWYAKTQFVASLPSTLNIRGIRVRQGNIEIGDEHFLDDMFTERRFASWQIGEIHIMNGRLKPNARRDGFEQSLDSERFLEQASLLGRHLSSLCRKSSSGRTAQVRVGRTIAKLEQLFASPMTFLDEEHYDLALEEAKKSLSQVEKTINNGLPEVLKERYYALKTAVDDRTHKPVYLDDILDGRRLRKFKHKSLLTHIAKVVVSSYRRSASAEELLHEILMPFARSGQAEQFFNKHS